MRSCILVLVTALAVVLNAVAVRERLPLIHDGFPDGSIITIYFKHKGDGSSDSWFSRASAEPVDINFYDVANVTEAEVRDIKAHIKISREDKFVPVISASFVNGKWQNEQRKEQPPGETPASDGFWRVDIYKHNAHNLNVFFQGFWSDVREFEPSLDGLKSVYITSEYIVSNEEKQVGGYSVERHVRVSNGLIPNLSVDKFKESLYSYTEDRKLVTFSNFSIGSTIELSAVMRASGGAKDKQPALVFKSADGQEIGRMYQKWTGSSEELRIGDVTPISDLGDLEHLKFTRTGSDEISLYVQYKNGKAEGERFDFVISSEQADLLDKEFEAWGHDGALLLRAEYSVPREETSGSSTEGIDQ